MASIEKRGTKWRVRWRDPDGTAHARSCPSAASARELKRAVEEATALGRTWRPDSAPRPPDLTELTNAWLGDLKRIGRADGTVTRGWWSCKYFLDYLESQTIRPDVRALSYGNIERYDASMADRGLSVATRRAAVWAVVAAWRWGSVHPDWRAHLSAPMVPVLPQVSAPHVRAATWAELDAVVAAARAMADQHPQREWLYRLSVLLRATGWRVSQCLALCGDDADTDLGVLTCRNGKSVQEKRGRTVPMPLWLIPIVSSWLTDGGGSAPLVGPGGRHATRAANLLEQCWQATTARREVYEQRPSHAFRVGLVTGLAASGASTEAVEIYVGHAVRGVRRHYLDTTRLDLIEVASKIPAPTSCVPDVSTSQATSPKKHVETTP